MKYKHIYNIYEFVYVFTRSKCMIICSCGRSQFFVENRCRENVMNLIRISSQCFLQYNSYLFQCNNKRIYSHLFVLTVKTTFSFIIWWGIKIYVHYRVFGKNNIERSHSLFLVRITLHGFILLFCRSDRITPVRGSN